MSSSEEVLNGTCRLCLQPAGLQHSHIFPEFLYQLVYDEKHRTELGSLVTGERPVTLQKGLREHLLCRGCEASLSKLERYASQVLFHKKEFSAQTVGRVMTVREIDYSRFKLFLLSLLWRAGVSSLPPFDQVKLGPHEERLRKALRDRNPGARHEYPCILSAFSKHVELVRQTLIHPYPLRVGGHRAYNSIFSGLGCTFVVSRHVRSDQVRSGVLTEDGTLPIVFLTAEQEDRLVRQIASRMPASWLEDEF